MLTLQELNRRLARIEGVITAQGTIDSKALEYISVGTIDIGGGNVIINEDGIWIDDQATIADTKLSFGNTQDLPNSWLSTGTAHMSFWQVCDTAVLSYFTHAIRDGRTIASNPLFRYDLIYDNTGANPTSLFRIQAYNAAATYDILTISAHDGAGGLEGHLCTHGRIYPGNAGIQNTRYIYDTGTAIATSGILAVGTKLVISTGTGLTLDAGGAITVTLSHHYIDTYGGAAADDLVSITGTAGQILMLRTTADARVVTVKKSASLRIAGDFVMDSSYDMITLLALTSTIWSEVGRSAYV